MFRRIIVKPDEEEDTKILKGTVCLMIKSVPVYGVEPPIDSFDSLRVNSPYGFLKNLCKCRK